MKTLSFTSWIMAAATTIIFMGCNVTSHTETAAGVDFSKYKTFSWAPHESGQNVNREDNDIVDNNIKNGIAKELAAKGWVENNSNPDVLLSYNIMVEHGMKHETQPMYTYPHTQFLYGGRGRVYSFWYPSTLMGYRSYNVPFKYGELTVNMIDAKSKKLVWQGWAKGDINTAKLTSQEVEQEVKSIFRKFKYPAL